jgi:phage/plasmid-like protein (TIGR03299 family)
MAHEIETMAFVGETPWHGLGVRLDAPPSIEEMLKQSGLDWNVVTKPSFIVLDDATAPNGKRVVALDTKAVVREKDMKVLGEVGSSYEPVQNKDAFNFFQPALEQGFCEFETAGSLRGGRRIWALARIKDTTHDVVNGDPVNGYFLLSNSHDGTLAIRCGFTGIRVVCQNTLTLAHHNQKSKLLQVRHTKNVKDALSKLQEIVDWQRGTFKATVEQMKALAHKGCSAEQLRKYVETVFEPEIKTRSLSEESTQESYDRLMEKIEPLFVHGRGNDMPAVAGTMWAAYNAVTEYLTWERGRENDTRLEALWFGASKKTSERAFDEALRTAA